MLIQTMSFNRERERERALYIYIYIYNRKQEVLRLTTCEKQRNPFNSRSQSRALPIV